MSQSGVSPADVIGRAESERNSLTADAEKAYEWFSERVEEMYSRSEAAAAIAELLECDEDHAHRIISDLVDDVVDPVQQIRTRNDKYVGIIDFEAFDAEGAYGYEVYDDVDGRHKRVVCAKCVEEAETAGEVVYAESGPGEIPHDSGYQPLLNRVTSHYANNHETAPEDVTIGASLIAGTTINSNTTWHAGNDGQGSGLDADQVRGRNLATEFDDHESADSGVHGVGTDNVASDADVTAAVDDHTAEDIHTLNQPFADHDNAKHQEPFAIEGQTNVEDFKSLGDNGARFEVDEDGNVNATTAPADVDNHNLGGTKHDADSLENLNSKINDGQIPTGVESAIAAADSPYTVTDENLVLVDTADGDVTVELASEAATAGNSVRVLDVAGQADTNPITLQTEGTETLEPGGQDTRQITLSGAWVEVWSDGADWFTDRNAELADATKGGEAVETEPGAQSKVDSHETDTSGVHGVGESDVASLFDVSDIQASSDVEHDDTSGGTVSDAHHPRYSDTEAADAAPVQTVNDQTGDVTVESITEEEVETAIVEYNLLTR